MPQAVQQSNSQVIAHSSRINGRRRASRDAFSN